MDLKKIPNVARTFNSIIHELETAEDISTMLGNSVANLKREIEAKRRNALSYNQGKQCLLEEITRTMERLYQCNMHIAEAECETVVLTRRVEEAKQRIIDKRKEMASLKLENKASTRFIESLEKYAEEHSLLSPNQESEGSYSEDGVTEDISEIDMTLFALSQ